MKVYTIENDNQIREFNVIYEDKNAYFIYIDGFVSACYKEDLVITNSTFKAIYIEGEVSSSFFVTRQLAQEFIDYCDKYGRIWTLQSSIEYHEDYIKTSEIAINKTKQIIAEKRTELNALVKEMINNA